MSEPFTLPKLRTKHYAAECLDCSPYTIDRLRRAGQIGFVRIGGRIRYTDDHLAALIKNRSVDPCQENDPTDQDSSADTGSVNGTTALCGAEPGSMPELGRRDAHRLAQRTFKMPKSD
jgi:hypothetical protein